MLERFSLNKPYQVLAVDPGLSGAAALLGKGTLSVSRDFKNLKQLARSVDLMATVATHIVIELVGARPGQGVVSMFSFGKATGGAYGAIYARENPPTVEELHPIKWQNWYRKQLNIPRSKEFDSRAIVCRILPEHGHLVRRKKDHNTADAILMGLWKLSQL